MQPNMENLLTHRDWEKMELFSGLDGFKVWCPLSVCFFLCAGILPVKDRLLPHSWEYGTWKLTSPGPIPHTVFVSPREGLFLMHVLKLWLSHCNQTWIEHCDWPGLSHKPIYREHECDNWQFYPNYIIGSRNE
jgi:hypothetical protein